MTIKAVKFENGETYPYRPMWDDDISARRCVLLKGKEAATALDDYQRKQLLKDIKPGARLTAVTTKDTGASTHFRVFIPVMRNRKPVIIEVTSQVAALAGFRTSKDGDIIIGGYGTSRSFELGYSLGLALWPKGTPRPHGTRNGEPDRCGGYALKVN